MTEFKLPELGENVQAGDVVAVLVAEGDTIKVDQPVLELETDKATVEVPSSVSGTVRSIHVKAGDKVEVGQVILTTDNGPAEPQAPAQERAAEVAEAAAPPAKTEQQPEPPRIREMPAPDEPSTLEFRLPDLGENVRSGNVVSVLVAVGDVISQDQGVLELETDKATVEVPSSVNGTVKEIHVKEGDTVEVDQPVLTVEANIAARDQLAPEERPYLEDTPEVTRRAIKEESRQERPKVETQAPPRREVPSLMPRDSHAVVAAAPNVRRLAREIGVDITQVRGTGPEGRISIDDVKRYAREGVAQPAAKPAVQASAVTLPDFSKWGQIETEAMSGIRRATAQQMNLAWSSIPHVTQFDKADIGELEQLRQRFAKKVEEAGGKLTLTAILLKVVAAGLKQFPKFNASIDLAREEIIYKKYYHIGVAVDTERGLLVPVIRDVDRKNIQELALELGEVAEKARSRKLKPEDMQGGTFTITNLGGIGGTNFTPIVNSPEVAILGVARSSMEPVYKDGQFEARLMLPLGLSYDHRLIDGADGARFLRWIVKALEEPFMLALQGW
jgi:pyruvate dehydrogenase E2 component (dihydrolipoamide acetyltransferase)